MSSHADLFRKSPTNASFFRKISNINCLEELLEMMKVDATDLENCKTKFWKQFFFDLISIFILFCVLSKFEINVKKTQFFEDYIRIYFLRQL